MKFLKKMLATILLIVLVVLLAWFLKIFFWRASNEKISSVCFGNPPTGGCFSVELATTEIQREIGLMNRKSLGENSGMFFIFDTPSVYPFWMKNTLISLDMIWMDSNYKVVFVKQNAQPCGQGQCALINPNVSAKYVLEINAGLAEKLNIKVGDLVKVSPGL